MPNDDEIITKRRQLGDAWRAMYRSPLHIVIDQKLAEALERAWDEYDAALTEGSQAEIKRLRALVKECHEFPDYPTPGEGEVSTEEDYAEQAVWRLAWNDLGKRVATALDSATR